MYLSRGKWNSLKTLLIGTSFMISWQLNWRLRVQTFEPCKMAQASLDPPYLQILH
jgi:hypothetical protein